jgi:GTP-binding protein
MPAPFAEIQFELGVAQLSQLPPDRGREVAFAGRSNAGKSSAINALTNRRKLAFVSKTPGRTQQMNFFRVGAGATFLVDLPGYGYAQAPGAVRREWGRLIAAYLERRESLRGLVVIMDIRRPLTPLDLSLLDWFAPSGKPILILLTKADKLSRASASRQLAQVRKAVRGSYPSCIVQLFSSLSGEGVEAARALVAGLLSETGAPEARPEDQLQSTPARAARAKKTPG